MAFAFPNGAGGSRSFAGLNLHSNDELSRYRRGRDPGSSTSPPFLSDGDDGLVRWHVGSDRTASTSASSDRTANTSANSEHTANTSASSESGTNAWDLLVIIKHTTSAPLQSAARADAKFGCRSPILCHYSPILNSWIEQGRTRGIRNGPQRSLEILIPPRYTTPEAVDILLRSMHGFNPFRLIGSFRDLLHLSIACSDLRCSTEPIKRLGEISREYLWRSPAEVRGGQDYVGWVFVALVFGWEDIFKLAWEEVWMGGKGVIGDAQGYLPSKLKEAIEKKRETTTANIIAFVRETSQTYLSSKAVSAGVKGAILETLGERLECFGVQLIVTGTTAHGTRGALSARELITHLRALPEVPAGYRGKVPDPPLIPILPHRSRSQLSLGTSSGDARGPAPLVQRDRIDSFRMTGTSAAMWNKITAWRPSKIKVINGHPAPLQGWVDFRAEFLASLENKVAEFKARESEEFRELGESVRLMEGKITAS